MGQAKNISILLALSGSILMMMLVSVLFFVPTPSAFRADITYSSPAVVSPVPVISSEVVQLKSNALDPTEYYEYEEPDEILKAIQEFVENNNPDGAKKLYNELYTARHQKIEGSMGGEVENASS